MTAPVLATVEMVVANGVRFLDSSPLVPGDTCPVDPTDWRTLINVDRLRVNSTTACILGQLCEHLIGYDPSEDADYYTAVTILFPDRYVSTGMVDSEGDRVWAQAAHGFSDSWDIGCPELTREWLRVLTEGKADQ